jgi:hypothetical protein
MRSSSLLICFALIVALIQPAGIGVAAPVIPTTWDIVSENFESGSLATWNKDHEGSLSLVPGGGRNGSSGLGVAAGQGSAYVHQMKIAKAREGYLTFWFNPNNVNIPDPVVSWLPAKAICLASIVRADSDWWPPLVSIYLRKPAGQGYKGFLTWPKSSGNFYDYQAGEFAIASTWQKITIGYSINGGWAAVWINGSLVRYSTDFSSTDTYGDVIELGKLNADTTITPSGSLRFDDIAFQVPRVNHLWVDATHGNDTNTGLTAGAALRTIQVAADNAGPGTTVHILPGVYRESVAPILNGSAAEAVRYRAENGPGTVTIRGSEPASGLTWTPLASNTIGLPAGVDPTKIYSADLSAWNLSAPPRFVVQLDGNGQVSARLPLAHEPDWQVTTEWKYHEFWWAADGGSSPAACDPITNADHNCDLPQRSMTQLTDRSNDVEPAGVEPGNLTTLGDLTGATLIAIDAFQGHYTYRRTITAHDQANGKITVDKICEHDGGTGNPGLGWGAKYYVEGKPRLLDTPGEWWYDATTKRLYLWPLTPANPASLNIEISRRENGFKLQNRSYTTLDGLTIELFNGTAVYQINWLGHKSYHNTVRNVTLRYANWGLWVEQSVATGEPLANVVDGFTLEDSEIAYIDTLGIRLSDWWEDGANPNLFTHSGVLNTVIQRNELHHFGFRTDDDNAIGISFGFANKLRFEGNHVHHIAHNGVQFSRSVIQSDKTYGFTPSEIKTGEILIKDNLFEKACQQNTDCGTLKFWGSPPDGHVFRDVLITGNIFRDTYGWSSISEKRQRYTGGTGSQVRGMGGYGLFVDYASGLHAYRNIVYNTAYAGYVLYGTWRDGEIVYWNNIAANSLYGFSVGGPQFDTHASVNTQIVNNIAVGNEGFGMLVSANSLPLLNTTIDRNLYFNNGWRPESSGGMWKAGHMVVTTRTPNAWVPYPTLAEIQSGTVWEDHGQEGNPVFWSYDSSDHTLFDGSWPNFHLTSTSSKAIEKGATVLPASLVTLLNRFGVDDWHIGTAYDIGRYEGGFGLVATPLTRSIQPGGMASYSLRLVPNDLPYTITLSTGTPPAKLTPGFSSSVLTSGSPNATFSVSDAHSAPLQPGLWYTLPVTASGDGFTQTVSLRLLVGGIRVYLPLSRR